MNKVIAQFQSFEKNENKKILFGGSIHPYRNKEDLEQEFQFCLQNGAVLCKWIPSSHMIDPSEAKCEALYELLRAHKIPLLSHTGPEPTVPTSYRKDENYKKDPYKFNHPRYLQYPLEKGVTVIAAHCSVPYYGVFDPDYKVYDMTCEAEAIASDTVVQKCPRKMPKNSNQERRNQEDYASKYSSTVNLT